MSLRKRKDALTTVEQVDEKLRELAEVRPDVPPVRRPIINSYIDGWLDRRLEITKGAGE